MSEEQSTVPTEDLRILFDAVCNSLDFGSGFLDTEEVEALRRLAGTLGVNPMVATPSEFVTQYAHAFEASEAPKGPWRNIHTGLPNETPEELAARIAEIAAKCRYCGRQVVEAPHPQEEVSA